MLNEFWKQFKSGTDIRGVAVSGAGFEVNLTEETAAAMVNGFILWLSDKLGKTPAEMTVSVGRDSRISGPALLKTAARTMTAAGLTVYDCGLASTPSMFMTTVEMGCDAALQITASHHPYYRNGLKFFTREGGLEGEDIEAILMYAQKKETPERSRGGRYIESDFMNRYAHILREKIKKEVNSKEDYDHPLKGFRIVVDAGNGAGGFYATDVLELLGADIRGSQFLDPDGMFPNHVPNPENEAAMASICKAVIDNHADLGVIFDTDVDRGGAVDSNGKEINRNRLVALASAIALEDNEGGIVVTDSITSSGLKKFIEEKLGGKHLRFKRGYKNVINEAIAQDAKGNCPLAIETSGHAAMRENYFLDDGAYLVTKIIIKMAQLRKEGKKLDSIIESLEEPVESKEIRIAITDKDFRKCGERVIKDLKAYADKQKSFKVADDNYEGIRVSFDKAHGDGWFLLRLSVHDPIMPLNIESDSVGGVDKIYKQILPFLEEAEGLETCKKPPKKAEKKPEVKAEPVKAEKKPEVKAEPAKAEKKPEVKAEPVKAEKKPEVKAEPVKEEEKPEVKAEPVKEEKKPEVKAEPVKAEKKPEVKAEPVKAEKKPEVKAEPVKEEKKPEVKAEPVKEEKKPEVKAEPVKEEKKPEVKAEPVKAEKKPDTKQGASKTPKKSKKHKK